MSSELITLPDGTRAYRLPPAIRDISGRLFHDDMDLVNKFGGFYLAADPEERPSMLMRLAEASPYPRVAWRAILEYLCFDTEPACAECGAAAWVFDDSDVRFLCRAHDPLQRHAPQDDDGQA